MSPSDIILSFLTFSHKGFSYFRGDRMLVDHRLAPAFRKNFTSICLYSWVEKGAGRRYCFVKNASRLSGENFDPEFSVLAVLLSRLPEFS